MKLNFDKEFNKQSLLIKILLLIIPVVGWVTEILVRLSVAMRKQDLLHIVALIVFVLGGWGVILQILDLIYLLTKGHLFLAD